MTQKQSNNHRSVRAHNHQEQKRYSRSGVQQIACSLVFFFTWRELFTTNLFLLTLRSTLTFPLKFWDAREKRPELWCTHNRLLHHDNTPIRTSLKTTDFVMNNNTVIIPHPPYSPDLAPCDCALFPELKIKLMGQCFETLPDIQREWQAVLPQCCWSVGKTMGSLSTFPRRPFWRIWQPKFSKLS
jgi:hypothetical protein